MGGLFSRVFILLGFIFMFAHSIRIKQLSAQNQARSLLSRLTGSSSGATNLKLNSGEASSIEDNSNQSSLSNGKFVVLSGGVNQSGLLLKGNSSGQTASAGDHDVQIESLFSRAKASNSAVSILNSLGGGKSISTSLTKGGSQILSNDAAATEKRETATINEIEGTGSATTTTDNTGSVQIDQTQTIGSQSGNNETNLDVKDGSGHSEIADEHAIVIETDGVKASTSSSSSSQVQINGSGTAQIITSNKNNIDIMKRLR